MLSRCAIGLLTWNGQRDVGACVRSILAQDEPELEICWIDNASSDATVETVRVAAPNFPQPRIQPRNIGFCGGHNLGIDSTSAPYYLALNQDVVLAPDYVRRLCDWMDQDPALAMTSGLILQGDGQQGLDAKIYSAGLAMGRGRFPFELGMNAPMRDGFAGRRRVPGVTGAAMVLRRSAMTQVASSSDDIFPQEFFAYFEEVDLAIRIARAGLACGVDGAAKAWHAARGQGGRASRRIRAHYFKNHWLVTLRNDSVGQIVRELPAILKGELTHYLPQYVQSPLAACWGAAMVLELVAKARREFALFSERHPEATAGRDRFYEESIRALREL